jgi:hypothetical protein
VFGLYQGLGSLARSLGPAIAGVIYYYVHPTAQFVLAGFMTACVAIWMSRLAVVQRGILPPSSDEQPIDEPAFESQ